MSSNLREILTGLTEAELMNQSQEVISATVEERLKGKISKGLAREILDTIYQEESALKEEIWDRTEAKISLDQNVARKK